MPRQALTLSAVVITHNQADLLQECLASLTFADEIVVVLDRCTDHSKAVARRFKARVIEGQWDIEGDRRNVGFDACRGTWILAIDSDERVPEPLAQEIRQVVTTSTADWHRIPIDNYVGDRLVRYGWGCSISTMARPTLCRKGSGKWSPQRVHPGLNLPKDRKGKRLHHALIHQGFTDIMDIWNRLDYYSEQRANDLLSSCKTPRDLNRNGGLATYLCLIVARFCKCYIRRKGYREGEYGVVIALTAGLFPILSWLRARALSGQLAGKLAGKLAGQSTNQPKQRSERVRVHAEKEKP